MEVEIISREIIKPAAFQEIPQDHMDQNAFKISLLDMLSPEAYTSIIFFYKMNKNDEGQFNKEEEIASLKLSLSKTLALFPVLAGKIKGNLIHCSNEDAGALFMEARVNVTMAHFLHRPNLQLLRNFLPFPDFFLKEPLETAFQVGVQVNFFSCGGIAISLCLLHKIIDGTTMSVFIKSWAASNKGKLEKLACGSYKASSSLFPAREILASDGVFSPDVTPFLVPQGKSSTTRRFVFDAMAISKLKARVVSETVPNPTSVEAVTCFIWKYAMKASRCKSLDQKELVASDEKLSCVDRKWGSVLSHGVNMRTRIQPPLSEYDIGNIIWLSKAYYEASNVETNLADLEVILRQSLLEINNDFMQKAIGEDGFRTLFNSLQQINELCGKGSESYAFTSWRNVGLNEVNFRWGTPIWTSCGGNFLNSLKNMAILMDTTTGEGIEAWIILEDETMNLLENEDEFLQFASPNPPIILDYV